MPASDEPPRAFSHRLQLFTGKGGVGKSTLVAALALHAARQGRRPLIVELGHRASMEGVLGSAPIGFQPREVARGVWAMNMEFEPALLAYVREHVKVPGVARRVVDNPALKRFFDAAPAVTEVATLHRLRVLLDERLDGEPRYDSVLVDLDATGHALMLLELPRVLDGLLGAGPLRRMLESVTALLSDPAHTRLNLVSLPRELPVQETIELCAELRSAHSVPLGAVVVNQVPDCPLPRGSAELLGRLEAGARAAGDTALSGDVALARRALARDALVREQIARLTAHVGLPVIELPYLAGGHPHAAALAQLGSRAAEQLQRAEAQGGPR